MYLYQAQGVRLGSELSNDEDEITETVLMSKDEVRNALANDEIKDGKTFDWFAVLVDSELIC